MKLKTLLCLSSFSLKLKEKWVAFMRADEVLNNNSISKPHRLKSYGFHLPLLGHQGEAVLVVGFLSTLLISLFNTAPTSATKLTLSITSDTTNCSTTTNPQPGDICLTTPKEGGMVVGKHTLNVTTDATKGWDATMTSTTNDTANLTLDKDNVIPSLPSSITIGKAQALSNNQWGVAYPYGANAAYFSSVSDYNPDSPNPNAKYAAVQPLNTTITEWRKIASSPTASGTNQDGKAADTRDIYFGVKTSPGLKSGDYKAEVKYTVTAQLPPAPTVTGLILNDTILTNQEKELAIEGTGMDNVTDIIICPEGEVPNTSASDTTTSNTTTNCLTTKATNYKANNNTTIASFISPKITNPGTYHVYASTGNISTTYATLIVQEQTTCRSGDATSDCTVDIDPNMIPIKYDEANKQWVKADITNNNPGDWYNYNEKKWANAVTIVNENNLLSYTVDEAKTKLSYYQTAKVGTPIDNNDVLGYWVYIPRYAYEVQRRDATDKFVLDEYPLPDNVVNTDSNASASYKNSHALKNDFITKFEKGKDDVDKYPAKTPVVCKSNSQITTAAQMWRDGKIPGENDDQASSVLAKDYRTGCNLSRAYSNDASRATNTTWATHPAFIWRSEDLTINEQLNGIWVGKFETTGTRTNPTIKPNQQANISENIGNFFTMAKSIGVVDNNAVGGNTVSGIVENGHNLQSATTHMLKNSEWGAVTYISSSIMYGAGVNNIHSNKATHKSIQDQRDGDGDITSGGVTGCGPNKLGDEASYIPGARLSQSKIEDNSACSSDGKHAYNQEVGTLASTTGNVYGVYDMAGMPGDYVMAGWFTDQQKIKAVSVDMEMQAKPPFIDLYKPVDTGGIFGESASWSISSALASHYNNDKCVWDSCGGQSLHETKVLQSVNIGWGSWGDGWSSFVNNSLYGSWFTRGAGNSEYRGDIYSSSLWSGWHMYLSFKAALLVY